MKILITLLLTLFISSQAYAQTATEIIRKGEIISNNNTLYVVIYDKKIYRCFVFEEEILCQLPKDKGITNY
jgi:hypothetical protein